MQVVSPSFRALPRPLRFAVVAAALVAVCYLVVFVVLWRRGDGVELSHALVQAGLQSLGAGVLAFLAAWWLPRLW